MTTPESATTLKPTIHTSPPTPTSDTSTPTTKPPETLQRGRLKRRRLSSHTPPRDPSPSRGHDRASGSRHRHHYRNHERASSSPFVDVQTPPLAKRNRRRSDAEPDHTFRGRARLRSLSRSRSPLLEGEGEGGRQERKRSQPPSRGRVGIDRDEGDALRRMRSYPNLYRQGNAVDDEFDDDYDGSGSGMRMDEERLMKGKGNVAALRV